MRVPFVDLGAQLGLEVPRKKPPSAAGLKTAAEHLSGGEFGELFFAVNFMEL